MCLLLNVVNRIRMCFWYSSRQSSPLAKWFKVQGSEFRVQGLQVGVQGKSFPKNTSIISKSSVLSTHHLFFLLIALLFALCAMLLPAADAAQVTLGWDKCTELGIAGYKIHYGTTSGNSDFSVDVGDYDSCTISGLAEGQTYYFSGTSYTVDNMESEFSEELAHTIPAAGSKIPASETETTRIVLEAEDAIIYYPFDHGWDSEASSNGFVWAPNGTGNMRKRSRKAGYAEFSFEAPIAANYVVWGRVLAKSRKDNSFFVSIDDGIYDRWNTKRSKSWIWDQVRRRRSADPVIYHLEAGSHTLTIKQREDGTKIDKIVITNDENFVP